MEKQSRKGKVFYGCNKFPECKFASWDKPVQQTCPQCEAPLLFEKSSRSDASVLSCRVCGLTQDDTSSPAEAGVLAAAASDE